MVVTIFASTSEGGVGHLRPFGDVCDCSNESQSWLTTGSLSWYRGRSENELGEYNIAASALWNCKASAFPFSAP